MPIRKLGKIRLYAVGEDNFAVPKAVRVTPISGSTTMKRCPERLRDTNGRWLGLLLKASLGSSAIAEVEDTLAL